MSAVLDSSADLAHSNTPTRAHIDRLEAEMRAMPPERHIEAPVDHTFGPGFYARTVKIPAGATAVGKVHATEHVFMLVQGELQIVTDGDCQTIRAPFQIVSPPGVKRAVHALTDCLCTNIHITTETDLAKLEAALITAPALDAPAAHEEITWPG